MLIPTDSSPGVTIILVNWNGMQDTLACLESLRRLTYPSYRVVVVDNGSTDGSTRGIRAEFSEVILVEAHTNLGFVGGNNLGLKSARELNSEYVLLLNNDTLVAPDFLDRLISVAGPAHVGVVGPMIYYASLPSTLWSAGGAIDWRRGRTTMLGEGQPDVGQFGDAPYRVDFVTGCALLIKMAVVDRIGPLEERFFAYFEDTEWGVRVERAGYQSLIVPGAKVWHKITPEARFASDRLAYYFTRNRLLFLWLCQAGLEAWFNTLVLDIGRTLASYALRPKWRHKRVAKNMIVRGLIDFVLRRFGPIPTGRRCESTRRC